MPLLGTCLLESIRLLANAATILRVKCIEGVESNEARCRELIELSLSMVTSLVPKIGYDRAAAIAKESVASGRTVRELCEASLDDLGLTLAELENLLDPRFMSDGGG
jgi:aspartate ammonia-lyase